MMRTDYTATERVYAVTHTDPPTLVTLEPGQVLSTMQPVTITADYDEAVALMPEGWEPDDPETEALP